MEVVTSLLLVVSALMLVMAIGYIVLMLRRQATENNTMFPRRGPR